jgi:hypothetical protein
MKYSSAFVDVPSAKQSFSVEGRLRASGGVEIIQKVDRVMEVYSEQHVKELHRIIAEGQNEFK